MSQKCVNSGCELSYDPNNNHENACCYHPSAPIFHEGLKGWSCCSKRVVDFNDFLNIPGCTHGFHCNEKKVFVERKEVEKDAKVDEINNKEVEKVEIVEQIDTLKDNANVFKVNILKDSLPAAVTPVTQVDEEKLNDAPDSKIKDGSACKRKGCKAVFPCSGPCLYHPGEPVFHEGSKGYTCCSRKVLEFDEFLKIQGCKEITNHRFTDVSAHEEENIVCRNDWYQTQTHVMVSLFVKKADKENTKIEIAERRLKASIRSMDGKIYTFDSALFESVDPDKSTFMVLGTKIEVNLKKANGLSWPSLEPTENITSWTTFGTTGKTGTIGGKEILIANDVTAEMLKKNK